MSPLKKARFAFSTGITKVDELREKRCTWTLRGWMGKDKEGKEVLMAEEIPKEKKIILVNESTKEKDEEERETS